MSTEAVTAVAVTSDGIRRLSDVLPSALAALDVAGFRDVLGVGSARHVVVLLIDGLGLLQLEDHADDAPFLASALRPRPGSDDQSGSGLEASLPTTTPANLASLGMGALPGAHGFVGASFWLPDFESVLSPLRWGAEPSPTAVQPEPTMLQIAERAGVLVSTISAAAYAHSGLTNSVLRGGAYLPAEDVEERISHLRTLDARSGPALTYVYWAEHDRVGHVHGVGSSAWRESLRRVDELAERMWSSLGSGAALIVTSDHGMVNAGPDASLMIEEDARLMESVTLITGEPRARLVYVREGARKDAATAWRTVLGDRADVFTRDQVIELGLIGPVDPLLEGRLGDLLVLARGDVALASRIDPRVSALIGQHGSRTPEETRVPGLILRR